MLRSIAGFEFRYQLRQPLLWATAGVFLALAFIVTSTDAFQIGGGIGSLNRNAPFVVVSLLGNLSVIGSFILVAFVATSALRDFEQRTDELVFSRPVRPHDLLLGRFLGSLAAAFLCFSAAALGTLMGGLMPWLDPERVGPFTLLPCLYGLLAVAFPTFAILGAFFFAIAMRFRQVMAIYVALAALLVAYFTANALFTDLESRRTAALLDPFGLVAFGYQTRYWTVAEKNSRLVSLTGELLWNRALWLGLALSTLAWAVGRFRYDRATSSRRRPPTTAPQAAAPEGRGSRIRKTPAFGPGTSRAQLASQFRVEARAVIGRLPFLLILAFGLTNILANISFQLERMLGTPTWPVTHLMLVAVSSGYSFFLVVILTFYAGETVWRERNARLDGVLDASARPTWVPLAAKVLALWAAVGVFIGAGMLGLAGFQLFHGYTRLEPLLYAQGFVVESLPYWWMATLALFLQAVIDRKLVGYLVMVLYLISSMALSALHFEHNLYRYARTGVPSNPYSDMNRWGHFAAPLFWFNLYWGLAAGLLLCLAYAAWVRGHEPRWRQRWSEARVRLRGPLRTPLLLLLAGFLATGAFVFYNTNVLNEYVPSDAAVRRQAEYEKKYSRHRGLPQPRIAAMKSEVDIFPAERRAAIRGSYRLVNRSDAPIGALHVGIPSRLKVVRLDLPPHKVTIDDRRLGYAIYELDAPLLPGQEIPLGFELAIVNPGFVNGGPDHSVAANGTFFHSRQFPSFGYRDDLEIRDPAERRRQGLPPPRRMAKIDDLDARLRNDLAPDADWLSFETTVSTTPDQIAIAPGTLKRDWTEGGRRYFHYEMDTPIPRFFAYLSARYAVRRDSWKDVAIEVFYHPGHEYNLDRMVDAIKKSLAYFTENFSPYQHRQIRIAEFPRFAGSRAASFPGTIPFSESIGFIARLTNEEAIDYPFYVTAHEVAHQWWGYQVLGAEVQGATMLSETMAQYSALMVMEKEYGPEKMRRFLKYELDRYLSGRGVELLEEVPLELVEGQPYIHYSKGSLVLYALKDQIGEAATNAALRRYVASVRFAPPPYTVSRDLVGYLAEAVPPDKRPLLDDLFRSITLFDNKAVEAASRRLPDGRYEVTLKAKARKLRADGKGVETETPLDDWIDVGVFGKVTRVGGRRQEPVLYLQKHHLTAADQTVQVVVDGLPARAGIDPYNKLIDRTPDDNVREVVGR
jgi:ABC-type transport system involved in multi-copper enzyme maturation permease subunit